jgi:hypothetical protein
MLAMNEWKLKRASRSRKWKVLKMGLAWFAISPLGKTAVSFDTWEDAIRFCVS